MKLAHARRGVLLSSLAFALSVLAGCSGDFDYGPTGTVSGRLTMDGKPLTPGTNVALMQLEKGYLAFGPTDAEGNFQLSSWNNGQLPIGKYAVMIQPPGNGSSDEEPSAEELLDGKGKAAPLEFPAKYRQTSTSGLEFDVKEGENTFDINLDPK